MQPIVEVAGIPRFKANAAVEFAFQQLAPRSIHYFITNPQFPAEDRRQLAQLVGMSLEVYNELAFVDDEARAEVRKAQTLQ